MSKRNFNRPVFAQPLVRAELEAEAALRRAGGVPRPTSRPVAPDLTGVPVTRVAPGRRTMPAFAVDRYGARK